MNIYPFSFFSCCVMVIIVAAHSHKPISYYPKQYQYQKSEIKLVKLRYENSTGERGLTSFYYDENGLNHMAKWELIDGSRSSVNFNSMDEHGNILMKYREFSDGITSVNEYEYDSLGNMIHELYNRSDGVTGEVRYVYGNDLKLRKAYCKGLNGWFYGEIVYRYDDEGKKISAQLFKDNIIQGRITYTYNNSGKLVREFWDFNGQWNQSFDYEYSILNFDFPGSYTSSNVYITNNGKFRLIDEEYDFSGEIGGSSCFIYNPNKALSEKIFYRSDGLMTITGYTYDTTGLLQNSYRKYSNGLTASFSYSYNGNRKLLTREMVKSDGTIGSEKYIYNNKGELEYAYLKNLDSWLSGTIKYLHDDLGRIKSAAFKGVNELEADLSFSYDEFNNLIKIHWIFSTGKTQTYKFRYEAT